MQNPFSPEVPPLYGEALKKALEEVGSVREPLVEGFLYKKSSNMIWAPDGVGKSLITLQVAVQGTVDNSKVFGELHVEKAFKTLYVQAERDKDESLERLKLMKLATAFNPENFLLTTCLQGINLRNEKHSFLGLESIAVLLENSFLKPDLVVLDPIYAMVRGGLKDDEGAAYINEFARLLQAKYGCSILFVHHANRGTRDKDSGSRVGEDMFGSRFLSAFCQGVYQLTLKADGLGTMLTLTKSSNANLEKRISLEYDPENYLSWATTETRRHTKLDKIYAFLRACKSNKKTFTFSEMLNKTGVSTTYLRVYLCDNPISGIEVCGKSKYGAVLYQYTGS